MSCGKKFIDKNHDKHNCFNCANIRDLFTKTCEECAGYGNCNFKAKA